VRCAKHRAVCERDPEKPKQRACMKCAGLKEKCEWPEVAGPGLVVDKGKGKAEEKEVVTSPRGGEKRKKKKMMAKVVVVDDEIVEVAGPSGSRSGFNTGPFLEWMDRLTAAVEAMTGQMARIADSTRSVSRSNNQLSAVETHASLGAHIPISVHPSSFALLSTATRTQPARELSDAQLGTPDRVL